MTGFTMSPGLKPYGITFHRGLLRHQFHRQPDPFLVEFGLHSYYGLIQECVNIYQTNIEREFATFEAALSRPIVLPHPDRLDYGLCGQQEMELVRNSS